MGLALFPKAQKFLSRLSWKGSQSVLSSVPRAFSAHLKLLFIPAMIVFPKVGGAGGVWNVRWRRGCFLTPFSKCFLQMSFRTTRVTSLMLGDFGLHQFSVITEALEEVSVKVTRQEVFSKEYLCLKTLQV